MPTTKTDESIRRRAVVLAERTIQNDILRTFGTRGDMRVWRMNTGKMRRGQRVIQFGVPGQADISGILPGGVRLEIEVKSENGRQSKEQRDYQLMIEKFGGIYVLARSVDDVWNVVEKYLRPGARKAR